MYKGNGPDSVDAIALNEASPDGKQKNNQFMKNTTEIPDSSRTHVVFVEAAYPGNAGGWMRYLCKSFRYPEVAWSKHIQGTVVVKFLVDEKGRVKHLEALTGAPELQDEALRVIEKSGKWIPATSNGHQVDSYKLQSITFKLESQ